MESAVEIASTLLDRLRTLAAANPDREVCGLLFGTEAVIDAATACDNVADDPATQFEIDPAALIGAYRAMREGGPALNGHFHSHPVGRAEPSPCDAASATGTGALWMIIAGGDVQLWRAVDDGPWLGRFERVSLRITAPCATPPASP